MLSSDRKPFDHDDDPELAIVVILLGSLCQGGGRVDYASLCISGKQNNPLDSTNDRVSLKICLISVTEHLIAEGKRERTDSDLSAKATTTKSSGFAMSRERHTILEQILTC